MPTGWIISNVALWVVVICETVLLLLLLRALGELQQQNRLLAVNQTQAMNQDGLPVGVQAPSYTATVQDNQVVSLEDFQGRKRVLAFVSPGCPACSGAVKSLNTLIKEGSDIKVLVIGSPDQEMNLEYAHEQAACMPIVKLKNEGKRNYEKRTIRFTTQFH